MGRKTESCRGPRTTGGSSLLFFCYPSAHGFGESHGCRRHNGMLVSPRTLQPLLNSHRSVPTMKPRILASTRHLSLFVLALFFGANALQAGTQISSKEVKPVVEPEESRFKIYGWIEAGITVNPDDPKDHQNFGRLFTDRANEPLLNQATIIFERTLLPVPGEYDWGFRLQGLFGSDARFIHYLGEFDNTMHEIVQPDIVEAFFQLHTPWLTEGGIDFKVGQFVTLQGAEVINATGNFFYSHTYSF